jgi:creatinine amidohydrolase
VTQPREDARSGQRGWGESAAAAVQAKAAAGAILILPIGSTEQHGPHLPTGVDYLLVSEVARRTAAALEAAGVPALVAPVMPFGLADHHMSFGGTFTLDEAAFRAVLGGLVRSGQRQGFSKIVLLNGHGGNIHAVISAAAELSDALDLSVVACTYWQAAPGFAQILEDQASVQHACEAETSMMLALAPDLVETSQFAAAIPPAGPFVLSEPAGIVRRRPFHFYTQTGVMGDPRRASAQKGAALFDEAARSLAATLGDPQFWQREAP